MINKSKEIYVNQFVKYMKNNYSDKINKIVVFGEAVDTSINNPESIDFAIQFIDKSDNTNKELLGEILSYLGDIVDKGDCSIVPLDETILSKSCWNAIQQGTVVY